TSFDCDWSSDVCSSDLQEGSATPQLTRITGSSTSLQATLVVLPGSAAHCRKTGGTSKLARLYLKKHIRGCSATATGPLLPRAERSEERRVGKEMRRRCR